MRTHPVNVTHLVFGLVFLGIVATWGLREAEVISIGGFRWVLPAILVIAGAAGLVATVARQLGRGDQPAGQPEEPGTREDG